MFKIVGIIIVSFFIIYVVIQILNVNVNVKVKEGFENTSSNEAGTASAYSASIKAKMIKLQDELLVSKYRKEYESTIINLDDYIGYLMLKQVLDIKLDGDMKSAVDSLNNLNILKNSRESLNATMTFLDKQ